MPTVSRTHRTSHGIYDTDDHSKSHVFYKTPFNMPVKEMDGSTWVDGKGNLEFINETNSYNLSGHRPGYETAHAFLFYKITNNTGSTYDVDTQLIGLWYHHDDSSIFPIANYNWVTSLPDGWSSSLWFGSHIGIAGWEIDSDGTYYYQSALSGNPSTSVLKTNVSISNVPSTTQLSSSKAGYIWVEGNDLCYIVANRWKHTMEGTQVSTSPGTSKKGYMWIDTNNNLCWVGDNGRHYRCKWKIRQFESWYSNSSTNTVNAGTSKKGYIWLDNEFGWSHISYIGNDGYKYLTGAGDDPYTF